MLVFVENKVNLQEDFYTLRWLSYQDEKRMQRAGFMQPEDLHTNVTKSNVTRNDDINFRKLSRCICCWKYSRISIKMSSSS